MCIFVAVNFYIWKKYWNNGIYKLLDDHRHLFYTFIFKNKDTNI